MVFGLPPAAHFDRDWNSTLFSHRYLSSFGRTGVGFRSEKSMRWRTQSGRTLTGSGWRITGKIDSWNGWIRSITVGFGHGNDIFVCASPRVFLYGRHADSRGLQQGSHSITECWRSIGEDWKFLPVSLCADRPRSSTVTHPLRCAQDSTQSLIVPFLTSICSS